MVVGIVGFDFSVLPSPIFDWGYVLSCLNIVMTGSQKNDSLPKTGADITADKVTSPGTCPRKPLVSTSR